jgi:ABC-type lipoprotein export system ATPase subunit
MSARYPTMSLRNPQQTAGFIFQQYNLIPKLNVLENVELPLLYSGKEPEERIEASKKALERVGLSDKLRNLPSQLSGGQQQRVSVARALAGHPSIIWRTNRPARSTRRPDMSFWNCSRKLTKTEILLC